MQRALLHRLCAIDELFDECARTRIARQLSALHADFGGDDARWLRKRLCILILPHRGGAFHELRPNGQRRMRAFQIELAIVVEPHPDDAEQLDW